MFAYQININCANHTYVQKIEKPKISLPMSCKWFSFTQAKYPARFNKIIIKVIAHKPLTHIAAKLYQPNIVENQCASKDITVSKDHIGVVKPNITRNIAENLKLFL